LTKRLRVNDVKRHMSVLDEGGKIREVFLPVPYEKTSEFLARQVKPPGSSFFSEGGNVGANTLEVENRNDREAVLARDRKMLEGMLTWQEEKVKLLEMKLFAMSIGADGEAVDTLVGRRVGAALADGK
jgi:hypothetical protein